VTEADGRLPVEYASDRERRVAEAEAYALAQYEGLSRAEMAVRLRAAEWDAKEYKDRLRTAEKTLREMPPLYRIQEMDARHKRVRALLRVPRRRSIPKEELVRALDAPVEYTVTTTVAPIEEQGG
jgi:hypothetical protein